MPHRSPQKSEADRTSHTRFGPRPVPAGHRPAGGPRRMGGPDDVSTTAKIIVWSGVALGVAGLTAVTAIAARKLVGLDDDDAPRRPAPGPHVAPRFSQMDEDEREAMRRRARAQAREDAARAASLRAKAGRGRSGNVAKDLTRTATDLSQGLSGVAQSLVGAFTAFRGVSGQATSIVSEFVTVADQLRSILNGGAGLRPGTPSDDRAPRP